MNASDPDASSRTPLTSIEICAGAGGQAVGLHNAGFRHLSLVELDKYAVETLRANVRRWEGWSSGKAEKLTPVDVKEFLKSEAYRNLGLGAGDLSLFAGGVPCPPFSLAGKRLGRDDERDLFPAALEIIDQLKPKAVMIENVRGILEPPEKFIEYRRWILSELKRLGYALPDIDPDWSVVKQNRVMQRVWRKVEAKDFGVPQLRPRAILVAFKADKDGTAPDFVWPVRRRGGTVTVRDALQETMRERCGDFWDVSVGESGRTGRQVYEAWFEKAETGGVAPTLVGGSKKHGGADLGPSRAKRAWAALGVDATGVANDDKVIEPDTDGRLHSIRRKDLVLPERDLFRPAGPMLTVKQAAIIQGFPQEWEFQGGKTARYRQVGNAFPPPVAEAIGRAIAAALRPEDRDELLADLVMEGEDTETESGAV